MYMCVKVFMSGRVCVSVCCICACVLLGLCCIIDPTIFSKQKCNNTLLDFSNIDTSEVSSGSSTQGSMEGELQ